MAAINVTKEIVNEHTTEEVLAMATKMLKQAIRDYDGSEYSAWAAGAFTAKVILAITYLEALNEKLAPKEPVVA